MSPATPALLRALSIQKQFGAVVAVADASFEAFAGEVHAVVGENGAGKSTLLRIAAGILPCDSGELWAFGKPQKSYDAHRAADLGVAMVQQHFALFGALTALENIMLGAAPTRFGGWLDITEASRRATAVLTELGMDLDLHARVETFSVAEKQRVEIARSLFRSARVIILDEPTAVLVPAEAKSLYRTLRGLADQGRAIVVVTHKLDEVEAHADVVTVMRRGHTLGTRPVARGSEVARLAGELVGADEAPRTTAASARSMGDPGAVKLRVAGLGHARLEDVSFEVRAGEIVGIAGVLGNGQTELIQLLGGLLLPERGSFDAPTIEVVHEDRHVHGMVLDATVGDNALLGELASFSHLGVINRSTLVAAARARLKAFGVVPEDPAAIARSLSGGNQQKVVLARALSRNPAVLVIAHPTRGVDLGATRAIHEHILAARDRGTAIVVVSADLAELRLLSTRILVMAGGHVVATLPPDADDDTLGAAMLSGARRA